MKQCSASKLPIINDARSVLDKLLNAKPEARESSGYGDYFLHRGNPKSDVYLITNEDPEFEEPQFAEAAEWRVVIRIVDGNDDDPWLLAIKSSPDRFASAIYEEFE